MKKMTAAAAVCTILSRDDCIIADVRTKGEYKEWHIPGAISVPVKKIRSEAKKKLKDKDRTILVYCRTGMRSRRAAKKLTQMGYTNVHDLGGIGKETGDYE